jgi:proteasome lid subunit RPN8/RPN11
MLQMPTSVYEQLRLHGEQTYPLESCGVLIGQATPEGNLVTRAIPAANASASPRDHFEIAPADLVQILRHVRAAGLDILGFYHSHPDHPAQPSATDLAEAHWLGCSDLITSVQSGAATETQSYRLAGSCEEDKRFEAEEIRFVELPNTIQS